MVSLEPGLGLYRSDLLAGISGLEHGFGTRHTPAWPGLAATVKQIHSATVHEVKGPGMAGEGDALITREPGLWIAVKTADCLPLLVVDLGQRQVAAIHAGWRGVAGHIIERTLERLKAEPTMLRVAIGPGIGACCFEVGPEVAAQFGRSGRTCIDLAQACRDQLCALGVPARFISQSSACTRCSETDFHSFRRDRESAGRMFSAIRWMGPE